MVSHRWNAPGATAGMLSMMEESLPVGAQLDLIVSTPMVLQALGSCADILSRGWDIDAYCQDPEWKDVMILWKSRQLHTSVREVDEDGLEAIQAVRDGAEGEEVVPVEMKEREGSGQ
jgi:hypothetical protein